MSTILKGAGGAPGIAIGHAAMLIPQTAQVSYAGLSAEQALARFAQAQEQAASQLRALAEQFRSEGRGDEAGIFDAQAMLVEDETLTEGVTQLVGEEGEALDQALATVVGQMRDILAEIDDPYLRERASDMDAVGQEIRLALDGPAASKPELAPGAIIIAADLTPTQTAGLRGGNVAGFATAYGGPTGHTAILARSLGIPAAVGLGAALLETGNDTPLILDGDNAQVVLGPSADEQAEYGQRAAAHAEAATRRAGLRDQPGQLADGTKIALWANVGSPEDARTARERGAEGIGLFRTEFLFLERSTAPSEDEQYRAYRETLEIMDGRTVVVRTLDIGGDKPLDYLPMPHEENPFLGVRGLRLCMREPALFQTQLRALLRAAVHGDLWIMLPMVATSEDLAWGREQVALAAASLAAEGTEHRADAPLGIMIETPAAAATADLFAQQAAFFSIGSNDLTQYAMAVDRGQAELAARYPHTAPAVFRLIALAAQAAHTAGIPIGVCGELGADPAAAEALAGLGLDELSMSPAAIPQIKEHLAAVTLAQARDTATRMGAR